MNAQPIDAQPLAPDLLGDVVALTAALCDIPSVSADERALADTIEATLRAHAPHLELIRDGDAIVARTSLGRAERVVIAGHIDTVPINDNLPTRRSVDDGVDTLWGRGAVDMKGGCAVLLALAVQLTDPAYDITWVWYDHEEVASELNGLGRLARTRPELLEGDFAILGEPSNAGIEGGCNGTLRLELSTTGRRAHSARSWMGVNAVHALAPILERLAAYEPATVTVDGLDYREGLNAVGVSGGVAGNVIPDAAAGARPGLDAPLAQRFVQAVGAEPAPKYGWTDVARFSELGIPAVNYGPGDPSLAHTDDERVPVEQIVACERGLRAWLTSA